MKTFITTTFTFMLLICSANVFGQELLGKDYDFVIKALDSLNAKYEVKNYENKYLQVEEKSKNEEANEYAVKDYTLINFNGIFVCTSILVHQPDLYYGKLNWDMVANRIKQGYEETNYIHPTFETPVYKSLDKWFKIPHYMSKIFMGDRLAAILYYPDVTDFPTK